MAERKEQACDVCGGVDDHPRHVVFYPPGGAPAISGEVIQKAVRNGVGKWSLEDLMLRDRTVRHFDCDASLGCAVCAAVERHTGGVRGQALIDVVETPGFYDELAEAIGAATANVPQED